MSTSTDAYLYFGFDFYDPEGGKGEDAEEMSLYTLDDEPIEFEDVA